MKNTNARFSLSKADIERLRKDVDCSAPVTAELLQASNILIWRNVSRQTRSLKGPKFNHSS